MSPVGYHHGSLRPALLARAEVALREVGVDGLSLRQLARDIGVSHGAPARHFRDKQSLLDALALNGFESLNGQLAAAAGGGGSTRERFEATARAYVSFATEHAELLQVMYATKHHETASEQLREAGAAGMTIAREMIAAAQRAGEVRSGDPGVLAVVLLAQVHGLAVLTVGDLLDGHDIHTALDASLDLLWRGLEARDIPGSGRSGRSRRPTA